jgi:DNA-binding NtrC family response regulator
VPSGASREERSPEDKVNHLLKNGKPESSHDQEVELLLVSPSESDSETLRQALAGTRWRLVHVKSCAGAAPLLASHVFPVIIRDQQCCELGCVHAIRCARAGPYAAPLIVAAQTPDCRVWEDVIDHGGFDVLCRPFEAAKVRRIVEFAYKHWCAGDIRRWWDRFDYPD